MKWSVFSSIQCPPNDTKWTLTPSSGYSDFNSFRSGYNAAASTTWRTVSRISRTQGCPFMIAGSTVIRSNLRGTADSSRGCSRCAVLHLIRGGCSAQIGGDIVFGASGSDGISRSAKGAGSRDGARGRSRTDTLLRAADFLPTSAFAAAHCAFVVWSTPSPWSFDFRCPPSALYTFPGFHRGLARH